MGASAVVFAYHDVGVRCLSVLLAHGVRVPLVVTHADDPGENVWFASVERLAREAGLEVAVVDDATALAGRVQAAAPDFIFSFYFRRMLPAQVLGHARRGAYNMHGSLLPRFRGRAPVNWAIVRGARETGATLHEMVAKPDAGAIVDQQAVPILPEDTAIDVFRKVTVAAEIVLDRALPGLLDGTARPVAQDLTRGEYCGGRRPEDGRIDWSRPAREIHDLVRAVAPPYPGAFATLAGRELRVLRTRSPHPGATPGPARLVAGSDGLAAHCADGGILPILACELEKEALDRARFLARFGGQPVPLE